MRLVFISSVTAMTPLRTISVTTGSAFSLRARLVLDFRAIGSVRPDTGECDHLGPLRGFVGDKLAKRGRRCRHRRAAKTGKRCRDLGIGETGVDLRVEHGDDFGGSVRRRTDA